VTHKRHQRKRNDHHVGNVEEARRDNDAECLEFRWLVGPTAALGKAGRRGGGRHLVTAAPFLHGARMMRSTTDDAAEVVGGDRERRHNRERHSLLARVTKANPSGCDSATITCSLAAEASGSGPPREPSPGSARRHRQTVPDTTVCLDAVSRPNQRPAQLANVLAET
jgi:hypothetical protein